jgi:Integrase core domain
VNHKKIQRLWREEGLRVPQRRRCKRHGTSTASDTVVADAPNRVWAVDFQFGSTTGGRPIKIVSTVDEHTRECLGGMVERSITGEHLIGELARLATERGTFPAVLRCDNGPEWACSALADWSSGQVGLVGTYSGGSARVVCCAVWSAGAVWTWCRCSGVNCQLEPDAWSCTPTLGRRRRWPIQALVKPMRLCLRIVVRRRGVGSFADGRTRIDAMCTVVV